MNHTEFFELIKQGLSGAYLMHGDEEFVKDSALARLRQAIPQPELNVQQTGVQDAAALIAACETLPFLAPQRLVICAGLPTGDAGQKLAAYLPRLPETTILLFFVRKKADSAAVLYKHLQKAGRVAEFAILPPEDAVRWVGQQAKKQRVSIAPAAARRLVALVGTELASLYNEFTKAAAYAGPGGEITQEIIGICVTPNVEYRVFDMVEYFLAGKTADGLRALSALLSSGESAVGLAALLTSRFKAMLAARELLNQGLPRSAAIKQLGGHPYAAGKTLDAAKRYKKEQLVEGVLSFSGVPHLAMTGAMKDTQALELALLGLGRR